MSIIVAIITVLLMIASIAVFVNSKNNIVSGVALCLAIIFFFSLAIVPLSIHKVDAGELAVVKHLGKITDVKTPGTHFDFWITNKYVKYDAKVQNVEATTMAYSADAQTMDIQLTLQYQIATDHVVEIATQYGSLKTLENRIQAIAIEQTKSVLSAHKAMDIIANRAAISPAVEDAIKNAINEEYFVNVVTVVLTNIDFSDAFELAVEEKMIAEQSKLKAEYENEQKVAKAEADAEAKLKAAQAEIDIAKAEAEALMIAANAEAEANRIIDESLTDKIIDKIYADNWNGELPDVIGSGDYIIPSDMLH